MSHHQELLLALAPMAIQAIARDTGLSRLLANAQLSLLLLQPRLRHAAQNNYDLCCYINYYRLSSYYRIYIVRRLTSHYNEDSIWFNQCQC
ncbi:hypothetical protein GGI35DRAFT_138421 [Trichoderma velutinum]